MDHYRLVRDNEESFEKLKLRFIHSGSPVSHIKYLDEMQVRSRNKSRKIESLRGVGPWVPLFSKVYYLLHGI